MTYATVSDRSEYVAEQTRVFPGETRERVMEVAEIVIRASGGEFKFEHGLNGFEARRPYFVYGVLASSFGREKWEFKTEPTPAGIRASVAVIDGGDIHGGLVLSQYNDVGNNPALYRLFWSRVEYVLAKRSDWLSCDDARAWAANALTSGPGWSALCALTAAPPPPLPPRRATRTRRAG